MDLSEPVSKTATAAAPRRHLSTAYIAMLAVSMVVGAGIFKSPAAVAQSAGAVEWLYVAWLAGGVVSFIGALCYAELATTFPNAGGDYHFIKLAYGRRCAFFFAWARFSIINTGQIALLGFVMGAYLNQVIPLGPAGPAIHAAIVIGLLTLYNLRRPEANEAADFGLTSLEVGGVAMLVAAAVILVLRGVPAATPSAHATGLPPEGFGLGLVYAMLAYGGWSDVATLSAEARDQRRGMVRALVASVLLITLLYLAANWALLRGLGLEGLARSSAPAADLMQRAFGAHAGVAIAIAVALATLTSIHTTMLTGARTTYACAHDWPALKALGGWDGSRDVPVAALWAQSAVALVLIALGATAEDGFQTMVDFTSPVFWFFMMLSGASVLVLRRKHPQARRPFATPLYPLLPLLFCLASAAMAWSALSLAVASLSSGGGGWWSYVTHMRWGAVLGVLVLGFGVLVLRLLEKRATAGDIESY